MIRWRCLLAVLLALGILVPSALAAPAKPRVSLSRSSAFPGQALRVTGHGFPARARARLVLSGRSLRRLRSGPNGGFRVRIRVPRDAAAGRLALAVRSRGIVVRRRLRVRVLSQPSQPLLVPEQPAPAPVVAPPAPPPPPDPPTLVAAGDIACRPELVETETACRQARTADLVETLGPDAVAVLGDNQYEHGELANFMAVYDPTWGRFFDITHPAVGNHEYEGDDERDEAPGYYSYFGAAAGDASKGYYRWQLGGWTMFVLNSGAINYTRAGNPSLPDDCWPVSCTADSEQVQWLRAELDTLPDDACVLAYWHHPRFSSGFGGANQHHIETAPLFEALYEHGAELLLTGHSHNYERFAAITPAGAPDPAGLRQFVVGTGGRNFQTPGPQVENSEILLTDVFGVLDLTLDSGSYTARFIREDGVVLDESTGTCHPPPAAP